FIDFFLGRSRYTSLFRDWSSDVCSSELPAAALRQQLYRDMDAHDLSPLWEVLHALVPPRPATPCVPALWKYEEVRPFLMRAGERSEERRGGKASLSL